jgi:ribosomal protein S18 acetylase RimI-like enzyme
LQGKIKGCADGGASNPNNQSRKYKKYKPRKYGFDLRSAMNEKKKITIRPIEVYDYPVLEEFLYQAIFLPYGIEPLPRETIFNPDIFIYIKDFGSKDDYGVLAEQDAKIIGMAWVRIIPPYGHLDDATPELAISVLPEEREKGIGTKMMTSLFEKLRTRGYAKTSLSVQKNNPAVRFYERLGYRIKGENLDGVKREDYLMIKEL